MIIIEEWTTACHQTIPPQTRHMNPQCFPAYCLHYSSLLNVVWGYATRFLCCPHSIMHTLRTDLVNNHNIYIYTYYKRVYAWFHRLTMRCVQYSFTENVVTLAAWQMALMFLRVPTFTDGVDVLKSSDIYRWSWCSCTSTCTYFHVQATVGVRTWRSRSGGLHMYTSSYTKDIPLSFQCIFFY